MSFNINAGRMRHQVIFLVQPDGSDDYGEPLPVTELFTARADVQVKSGSQLFEIGEQLTTQVITCLMWYDPRAVNSGWVRWNNVDYEVQHVKPDAEQKAMMVTARIESR